MIRHEASGWCGRFPQSTVVATAVLATATIWAGDRERPAQRVFRLLDDLHRVVCLDP